MSTGRELLAEAARQESARVYGSLCKEHRNAERQRVSAGTSRFARPAESYRGPAPKDWIDQLVAALDDPTEDVA